jgi:DUF4097 and DUF4098 domain-containing protein YvlB
MKKPLVITLLVLALLFVLAGIGVVVVFTINNAGPFLEEQRRVSVTEEESKTLEMEDGPVSLVVNNDAGNVTVTGGDGDTVEIQVVKTGNAATLARAEIDLDNIEYTIDQDENLITITYKISKATMNNIDTVDFMITVPGETTVDIVAGFGEISVSNIVGDATLENEFGDVSAENIEGGLSVNSKSGTMKIASVDAGVKDVEVNSGFGSVTVGQMSGRHITIMSSSGNIDLTNVRATGDLKTSTEFGNTTYENGSADSLSIETKSGKVSLTKVTVRAELTITSDFGEIELVQAMAGSYDLHTNSGSIDVDGAQNQLKANTDFGGISIENAENVTLDANTKSGAITFTGSLGEGPHTVITEFGPIKLNLPSDSKLDVNLETDFGNVSSDIPITVILDGKLDKKLQAGTMNGGGDSLTVQTKSGDINITAIE